MSMTMEPEMSLRIRMLEAFAIHIVRVDRLPETAFPAGCVCRIMNGAIRSLAPNA
jgi:hypothetical protein